MSELIKFTTSPESSIPLATLYLNTRYLVGLTKVDGEWRIIGGPPENVEAYLIEESEAEKVLNQLQPVTGG